MDTKKETALKFLLRSYERKRRNPILRYLMPDWTPRLIGLMALAIILLFAAVILPKSLAPTMSILSLGVGGYVWWKGCFRTRSDERSEFIKSAEKIGVAEIAAGDFYDAHAKKGVLM